MANGELRKSWSDSDRGAADRLDYQVSVDLLKVLTDIRFRCLSFVTAVIALGGAAITWNNDPAGRAGLAVVGLIATLGIAVYELRNSQLYEAAMHRAKYLEAVFGCWPSADHLPPGRYGGVFTERLPYLKVPCWGVTSPEERQRHLRSWEERKREAEKGCEAERSPTPPEANPEEKLPSPPPLMRFWFFPVKHDIGLGLIYSAALGGWAYLAVAAFFVIPTAVDWVSPPWVGPTVGCVVGVLVAGCTLRQFAQHDDERIKPVAPR